MFVDTTVFIDYFRDYSKAEEFLKENTNLLKISIIVKLELIDGFQKKREIGKIEKSTKLFGIETIHISEEISNLAEDIFKNFRHSHGISVNDALIAATAVFYKKPLFTHNTKHFDFIPNLKLLSAY